MNIIIAGEIAKVSTRADQTLSVHFSTQELNAEESARLFGLKGKFLKAFLTDENIISDVVISGDTISVGSNGGMFFNHKQVVFFTGSPNI